MASAASIFPEIAGFNPTATMQQGQLRQQQLGLNALQAQRQQAEIPLIQQQTQKAGIENQLAAQGLKDNQILRDAYAEHADADWSDPQTQASLEKDLVKNGISYQGLSGYRNQTLKWQQDLQGLDENRLKIEDTLNQRTADILQGYKDIPDAQKPQIWAQVTAPALNGLHRGQFDATNPLVGSALDSVIGTVAHHKQMVEDAKNAQETKTSAATAEELKARTAETNIKTQLEQAELDLHKALVSSPQSLDNFVERSIPKAQYPQLHQAAVNEASMTTNIKDLRGVVGKYSQDAREQEKTISIETNPKIMAVRRAQEEALANYHNALQQGDTARGEYFKSLSDYNQTLGLAKTIDSIVDLAKRGNPIPAKALEDQIIPQFTNAMEGIKARGGYGNDKAFTSARDTALNMFRSAVNGKPLDASSLEQIMPYVRTITNGANETHNQTVRSIRQGYGQNHPLEPKPYPDIANAGTAPGRPTGAPTRKVGDKVTLNGGQTVTIKHVYPDGTFD